MSISCIPAAQARSEGGRRTPPSPFVTRFAPSPTGLLHAGHAYSALCANAAAVRARGRFLLRIEDIDLARVRPVYEAAIFEDLRWLGLQWETPVLRQSEETAAYRAALKRLNDKGLAYRCFRTRREVAEAAAAAPHGPDVPVAGLRPAPDEEADRLRRGDAFAWRLDAAAAATALGPRAEALWVREEGLDGAPLPAVPVRAESVGDIVLARKDVGVAYHLACVVDDARQDVTCVVRGEDLRSAATVHVLLQALLDLPQPIYRHHPLIHDAEGRRLAKRRGSPTLRDWREGGGSAAALIEDLERRTGTPLSLQVVNRP